MRDIRFRAWSKKDNCWQGGFCIHSTGLVSCLISPDGDAHWDEEKEDLILMQYTNLKDKNGGEIYEGDIYKHAPHEYGFHRNDPDLYVVESMQNFFEEKGLYEGEYGDDFGFVEVIGNIYENPELLESELKEKEGEK